MTIQDNFSRGMRSAGDVEGSSPAVVAGFPLADLAGPHPVRSGRLRFVLGVFANSTEGHLAVASLTSSEARTCEVILVCDAVSDGLESNDGSGAVVHRMDAFSRVAPRLREVLAMSRPFSALWDSMSLHSGTGNLPGTPGLQRLFQHLVHRLSKGASVVAVRAPDPELQLAASRVLLDAECEVLLTHEVLQSAN
jgi:hypothetical protein